MIGKMDQLVTVYTASFAPDGFGGYTETLASFGDYWAEVTSLTGDERMNAMRGAKSQSYSFKMHNFDGFPVSTTSQIEWDGTRFDVVDVVAEGVQKLFITFKCVAGELNG